MHEAEERWQEFAEGLNELKEKWDEFREVMGGVRSLEELSLPAQKLLSTASVRSEFFTALPRILDVARRNGGLEYFLLTEQEEEETD